MSTYSTMETAYFKGFLLIAEGATEKVSQFVMPLRLLYD